MSLVGLSWPLFIGDQVSRIQSGFIQIHHVMAVYILFPYSNITYVGFYLRPISLWALTQIYSRGTNATGPSGRTLISSPRDSIWILDSVRISSLQIFDMYIIFDWLNLRLFIYNLPTFHAFYFHRDFGKWASCFWRIRNQLITWTNTH
jgi:hypothetical protein